VAGDIPQFSKGRFGKVTAQNMNEMARAARHSRNDLETSPTPFARESVAAPGVWPIMVKLGNQVTKDDTVVGYDWREAYYLNGDWSNMPGGRIYNEDEATHAVPLGVSQTDMAETEFTDKFVMLNYINTHEGTILYFEPGGGVAAKTTKVLQTLTYHYPNDAEFISNCAGFGSKRQYLCQIVIPSPNWGGVANEAGAPPFVIDPTVESTSKIIGYNLLEYNDGDLGGVAGVNDCSVSTTVATIPNNTYVLGTRIAGWMEEYGTEGEERPVDIYAFTVANDLCVSCCGEDSGGLLSQQTTRERGQQAAEVRKRYWSPTSILEEMLK